MKIKQKALTSLIALTTATLLANPAIAADKIIAVASFSIIEDMARQVAGELAEVSSIIPAGQDPHIFSPKPSDAAKIKNAKIVFTNGLNYEGWINRMISASGFKGVHITTTKGIKTIAAKEEHHDHGHDHHDHDHGDTDPHAWQSVAAAKIYVANIKEGFCKVDAKNCKTYEQNANTYLKKLDELDKEIKAAWSKIPEEKRNIIVSHNAFSYYGRDYKINFMPVQSMSTASEPTMRQMMGLIDQVKQNKVKALFVENISSPRLIDQISKQTGLKPSGELYSDSLTKEDGQAPSYLQLIKVNTNKMTGAIENAK